MLDGEDLLLVFLYLGLDFPLEVSDRGRTDLVFWFQNEISFFHFVKLLCFQIQISFQSFVLILK